jgi:hypothetical protein
MSFILPDPNSELRTPLSSPRGPPVPPNIHDTRDENKTIIRIDKVCEEIDTELEKLILYLISKNEHISEGWNDSESWTCKSPFSTDMNDGFLIPPTWAKTGNEKVFGKTRGGDTQTFPCDAVIKYLQVGKFGDGKNLYEQALINVCHNRASVSGKPLYFGESDDSESDDIEFYYDSESDDNPKIQDEIQEILNLWKSASYIVKSNYEMLGVIVIGFSEFPEVDIAVLVGIHANPLQPGSVGQQIAIGNISQLQNMEDEDAMQALQY